MHLLHSYNKLIMAAAALLLLSTPLTGRTDPTPMDMSGQGGIPVAPSASKLQVTGTAQKVSIDADHADVQSAIKAIFDQAKLQFTLDSSVTGQLTLRLTDQSLDVTLDTICKQTFLRYHRDAGTGIYTFEQDTDAIKAAFTHLRDLNLQMRQQLRDQGLELPSEEQIGLATNGMYRQGSNTPIPGKAGRGDKGDTGAAAPARPDGAVGGSRQRSIPLNNANANDILGFLNPGNTAPLNDSDKEAYFQFLRQNSLVSINTQGQEVAVTDVFTELQRQSNTSLLVDPDVPRGPKFRMQLTLRPTTLVDALNLLCPALHLNWRRINSSVFITPTSDFQIFWGSSSQPRVIYGQSPVQSQRGFSNGGGNGQNGFGGGQGSQGGPGGRGTPTKQNP